jgi:hypothetical protein
LKAFVRLFAGSAALVALSLTATACDTSPFAARVNSQVIKQTALNAELKAWASNPVYVNAFNSSNSSGLTVAGAATGTYSTAWVAGILGGMIDASVVRQHVHDTGQVPNPATAAASRSVNAISQPGWEQFPAAFRQTLVDRLAEASAITPATVPVDTLKGVYDRYLPYFFTEICTVQSSAFNQADAQALAASGLPNGTPICYNQTQFEAQSTAFQTAILGTAVGKTAPPIKTTYGYVVVKVVSRDVQPFSPEVQRVLSVAILSAEGSPNPTVDPLIAKARVSVNPTYGTWKSPDVVPPTAPNLSA